jgi:hypothetical protein
MSLHIPSDSNNPGAKEHEFDISQNEVFSGLAGWMGFVGIMIIIFGSLYCVQGVLNLTLAGALAFVPIGQGVCLLLIGAWTWSASRSFKQIVTSEGMDITLLMHAMKKLRSVYTLQGILLILVILLVIGLLFLMMGHGGSGFGT